jgi:hypothetical protein
MHSYTSTGQLYHFLLVKYLKQCSIIASVLIHFSINQQLIILFVVVFGFELIIGQRLLISVAIQDQIDFINLF